MLWKVGMYDIIDILSKKIPSYKLLQGLVLIS